MHLSTVKNRYIFETAFEEMVGGRDPEATCTDDEDLVCFANGHCVAVEMWRRRVARSKVFETLKRKSEGFSSVLAPETTSSRVD